MEHTRRHGSCLAYIVYPAEKLLITPTCRILLPKECLFPRGGWSHRVFRERSIFRGRFRDSSGLGFVSTYEYCIGTIVGIRYWSWLVDDLFPAWSWFLQLTLSHRLLFETAVREGSFIRQASILQHDMRFVACVSPFSQHGRDSAEA